MHNWSRCGVGVGVAAFVSVASLLGGCAHAPSPVPPVSTADYRLGEGDVVEVAVWKEPALSAAVPVRPDGKISLPMAGDVRAEGRTTDEIQHEVAGRLRAFVDEPVVTVMVKEVHAARFFVLGEVAHPGAFPLAGRLTVLEAISLAGGATEFARTGRVVVLRHPQDGKVQRLFVDVGRILDGRADPLVLTAGDTVYVP